MHLIIKQNTKEMKQSTSIVCHLHTAILLQTMSIKTLKCPKKLLILHFLIKNYYSLNDVLDVRIV